MVSRITTNKKEKNGINRMTKSLILFIGIFVLFVAGTGLITAEKTWNFNNHTVDISDNLLVGGQANITDYVSIEGAATAAGNLRFSAASPYIKASSYIVIPGGLYASGGNSYFANVLNLRGGIRDDQEEDTYYASKEGLAFVLDYNNDDADTEYFVWQKNAAGFGVGTELMRLTEAGDLNVTTGDICLNSGECLSNALTSYTETDPDWLANYSVRTGTGNVVFDTAPSFSSTIDVAGVINADATSTAISADGDLVFTGSGDLIDFSEDIGDKILLYSNLYGLGIESSTLTSWSNSQFRWKTGGTSAATGIERMLLTTSGLEVVGNLTVDTNTLLVDSSTNRVGIGTTTPDNPLEIQGALGQTGLHLDSSSGAAIMIDQGATTNAGGLYWQTGGTDRWWLGSYNNGDDLELKQGGYGGTTIMAFDNATGNVGIGTAAPLNPLDVDSSNGPASGTSPQGGISISDISSTGGLLDIGIDGSGTFYSWIQSRDDNAASYYNLALNPVGGNVGIGTSGPQNLLNVAGDGNFTGDLYVEGGMAYIGTSSNYLDIDGSSIVRSSTSWTYPDHYMMRSGWGSGTGDYLYLGSPGNQIETSVAALMISDGLGLRYGTGSAAGDSLSTALFNVSLTGNVSAETDVCISGGNCLSSAGSGSGGGYWTANGLDLYNDTSGINVGIGTATVDNPLHVYYSDATAIGSLSDNDPIGLQIENTNSAGIADIMFRAGDADGHISYNDVGSNLGNMYFRVDGAGDLAMMIENTGNVGIGTTSPATALDVAGAVKTSRLGTYGTYNSAQVQGIWSISETYPISTASDNFGTQYGIGYAYNQNGGSPFASEHQIVFTNNGAINAAIGLAGDAYFGGDVGIGTTSPSSLLEVATSDEGARNTNEDALILTRYDTGSAAYNGFGNSILFQGETYRSDSYLPHARIKTQIRDHSASTAGVDMSFELMPNDTATVLTERMRLNYDGNLSVDTNTLFVDAVNNKVGIGDSTPIYPLDVTGAARVTGDLTTNSNLYVGGGIINGQNSEKIYVGDTDDLIKFQGGAGTDNTDLTIDVDGTYPVIYSTTDTNVGFSDDVNMGNKEILNVNGIRLGSSSSPGSWQIYGSANMYTSGYWRGDNGLYVGDDEYWYRGAEDRIDTTDNVYLSATTYLGTTSTYFATGGALTMGSQNIAGVNKLTVTTIDPIYNIGGDRYATYAASISGGVKEEVTGNFVLTDGKYVVDFDNLIIGSDLWVFYQIVDFGKEMEKLQVILTPGFNGNVWYEKDPEMNTLTIYGSADGEVSFRMTANRFDYEKFTGHGDNETKKDVVTTNYADPEDSSGGLVAPLKEKVRK